jgi:hypothetical protein
MKFQPIRSAIAIVALFCIILATSAFRGCGTKDPVRQAVEASYRLPVATNTIVDRLREGRDRGIITADQAAKFGGYLNDMAKAEVVYVGMVRALNDAIKATGKADPATILNLRTFFDASVIAPFLHVLELAKVLSASSSELILVAISTVRLLLTTIGKGIGSTFLNALAGPGIVAIGKSELRTV